MARARTLKPGFFANEHLADCSAFARLLFAGLWLIADREGRLEDRPRKIKAEIFPHDQLDCDSLLGELVKAGFIARYQVEDNKYIQVLNFEKHQNPHPKETASTIPAEEKNLITRQEPETPAPAGPSLSSPLPIPMVAGVARATLHAAQERVLDALGCRNDPTWLGDAGIVEAWLNGGADLDRDILPTINRLVRQRGAQGPPRSLKYFSQAIADAMITRSQKLPTGTARTQEKPHVTTGSDYARAAADIIRERSADSRSTSAPHGALLAPERRPSDLEGETIRLVS